MNKKYPQEWKDQAKEFRSWGMSYAKIGKTFGVNKDVVYAWLNRERYCETSRRAYRRNRESLRIKDAARWPKSRDRQTGLRKQRYDRQTHEKLTYFIFGGDMVKIGTTNNVTQRLRALKNGSPVPLELVGTTSTPEIELHDRFERLRSHGEWYNINQELQSVIDGVL